MQSNVIKIMIIVSAFYAALWFPHYTSILICHVVTFTNISEQTLYTFYYVSVFSGFLYTSIYPFMYVTKFEPVKGVLLRIIHWKQTVEQASENVTNAGIGLAACCAGNTHARN